MLYRENDTQFVACRDMIVRLGGRKMSTAVFGPERRRARRCHNKQLDDTSIVCTAPQFHEAISMSFPPTFNRLYNVSESCWSRRPCARTSSACTVNCNRIPQSDVTSWRPVISGASTDGSATASIYNSGLPCYTFSEILLGG